MSTFKYITDIDGNRHLLNINNIAYISDKPWDPSPKTYFVNMIDGKTFRIDVKQYGKLVDFLVG